MKHPVFLKLERICERIYIVSMGLMIVALALLSLFLLKSNSSDLSLVLGLGLGFLFLVEVVKTFLVWIFSGQIPRIGTVVTETPEEL